MEFETSFVILITALLGFCLVLIIHIERNTSQPKVTDPSVRSVKQSLPAYGVRVMLYVTGVNKGWHYGVRCKTDEKGDQYNIEGGGLERETVTHYMEEPPEPSRSK